MPVLAIIPAIVAVSSVGVAGFGAVLAGTASLGMTFAAVGAVGATLGAIGEVAGIKELKTAGMVLGGIGGVGSLASAVGAFGEGATLNSVFGSGGIGEAAGGGDFIGATSSGGGLINGAGEAAGGGDFIGTSLDAGTGQLSSMDVVSAAAKMGGYTQGAPEMPGAIDNTAGAAKQKLINPSSAPAPVAKQVGPSGGNIVEGPTPEDNAAPTDAGSKVTGTVSVDKTTGATKVAEAPGFWGTTTGQLVGMGLVQGAGSFLAGAFDEVKPAQAAAYNAQAAANNAQAALSTKELSNMNSRIPVARRLNVTGQPIGLINRG